MSPFANFNLLVWQRDRLLIGDLLFRLELTFDESDPLWSEDNFFKLYKPKELVEQYEQALIAFGCASPKNIFEIGLHDGGSMVLWNELFHPDKLIGIDIQKRGDSEYFKKYVSSRKHETRMNTFWGIDQSDRDTLRKLVAENFDSALDLVIDDASHYYDESKASFETLFPLLRPGGLYVVEDWQWSHWREFQGHEYFRGKQPLTNLITEIAALSGSALSYSPKRIQINSRMAVIERGEEPAPNDFRLPPLPKLIRSQG